MKVSVLGLGNMGCAIANQIAQNGYEVVGWEYFKDVVEEINRKRENSRFLKGVRLSDNLHATNDILECAREADFIFIAIPSAFIRASVEKIKDVVKEDSVIVNLSKGIEEKTCLTASGVLRQILPHNPVLVLSGPSIANEFSQGFPTGVFLAGGDYTLMCRVAELIETDTFRTRFSDDPIGVEWGGILKNIYAIGLGLMDGAGYESINFKAAFLTGAAREMADLGEALGGKRETFSTLAGIGDLIATALSPASHNRSLGVLLAQGATLQEAERKLTVLPEGVKTLRVVCYLAEKYHIPMPIACGIYRVLYKGYPPLSLVEDFIRIAV